MQYTMRNIPAEIDNALREEAAAQKKSLNQVLLDAVARGLGLVTQPKQVRDLSDVAGKCSIDDKSRAIFEEQRQIDPRDWE